MARKRRKASSQRRKPGRTRRGGQERSAGSTAPAARGQDSKDVAASEPAQTESSHAAVTPAPSPESAGAGLVTAQPVVSAQERASWPTRRKRSQIVNLPVEELDHVRSDLARIGVLSLGMVVILVVLTFVLR